MAGKTYGKPDEERDPLEGLSYLESIGRTGRKRRKDATGRKTDYHKGTATLSVRLPEALATRVRERAKEEGMTVNAWLATLIIRELGE